MPKPDRELVEIQLRTLYRLSAAGRLLPPAPRVAVSSGGGARFVRVREDIPQASREAWQACADDRLRDLVDAHAPVAHEYRGPAFLLPPLAPTDPAVVPVAATTPIHPELVARGWLQEEQGPYLAVMRHGFAVSLCYSARSTPEAAEAGVETAESYRGRGLVVQAVASWAARVQDSGRLAFYSTEWTNDASRRVVAKLGGHEFGENRHLS